MQRHRVEKKFIKAFKDELYNVLLLAASLILVSYLTSSQTLKMDMFL
jgi:hypothetical protein